MLSDFLPFALHNTLLGDEHMHFLHTSGAWDVEVMSILWSTHTVVFVCSLIHYPATAPIVRGMLFFSTQHETINFRETRSDIYIYLLPTLEKFILIIICQSLRNLTLASLCSATYTYQER